jgi:hypothetical protein
VIGYNWITISVKGADMSEQWYKDLPEDAFKTETDKAYEKALAAVRKGLENGSILMPPARP